METVEITIERRTGHGKSSARKLRRAGKVPGVLYGPKRAVASIAVAAGEIERKLTHLEGSHLIRLLHAGRDPELHERMVLLREMQRHPVTGAVLHTDFYEVDLTERLTVSVPLHFVGKAAGVVEGGILQPLLREVEVECLPTEIPESITVDVTHLGIHEAVHVGELTLPAGVTPITDRTQPVVTVLPPTVEAPKAAEAPEGAAEGAAATEAAAAPTPEPSGSAPKGGAEK
jgi:large subunit ribosomal protein L25